ncbi:MAG: hypothetical protein QOJ86_1321 [Bradyrhizobium sp.]|jgi:hypothetical protein|nr:hypothetical protein [Bradyrhizobium sp.]
MPPLADMQKLIGFFSYSHNDDEDSKGALSDLRDRIQRELRGQLGRSPATLQLWQDKGAIAAGALWESEIGAAIEQAAFFIPIVTPSLVRSSYCLFELERFLVRERAMQRHDLVFPILYIRVPGFDEEVQRQENRVLSVLSQRQCLDWRELRHNDINSTGCRQTVESFCADICDALGRSSPTLSQDNARQTDERSGSIEARTATDFRKDPAQPSPVAGDPENKPRAQPRPDAAERRSLIKRLLVCARQGTEQSRPLQAPGGYVPQRCDVLSTGGRSIRQDVPLAHAVRELIDRQEHARILLTGDYGYGKTSFCQMLTAELCNAAEAAAGDRNVAIPFYLSLSSSATDLGASVEANLAEYANRHGAAITPSDFSRALSVFPNVVIIFDALDELAGRADFAKVQTFVQWIERVPRKHSIKIVVTSRSMLFQRERDYRVLQPTNVFRLKAFDPTELAGYLQSQSSSTPDSIAAILTNDRLREICATPIHAMLLASYIRNYGPDRIAGFGDRSANAEIITLYRDFIDSSLTKAYVTADADVIANDRAGIWSLETVRGHVHRLAFHWYARSISEWDPAEFRAWIGEQVKDISGREIEHYCLFLANCAFLTLNGDYYRFLHRSFSEFLVAELAASELLKGDLTHWEVPFHSEIWEHIYHILDEAGFHKINFDTILPKGGPAAIGNILLMAARHKLPPVLPLLRTLLVAGPFPTLRCVAIQGIGLYRPGVENARTLKAAFGSEKNSVVRKIIQLTAQRWLRAPDLSADVGAELIAISEGEIPIAKQDAVDIARPTVVKTISPDIVHQSYRNALLLRDGHWNAYAIPILLLGAMQDDRMLGTVRDIGTTSQDPEIRESYRAISAVVMEAMPSGPALTTALNQ